MNIYSVLKYYRGIKSPRLKLLGILMLHILHRRYLYISIDPSLHCNFRCRLCFFSDPEKSESLRGRFSLEDIQAIANAVFHPDWLWCRTYHLQRPAWTGEIGSRQGYRPYFRYDKRQSADLWETLSTGGMRSEWDSALCPWSDKGNLWVHDAWRWFWTLPPAVTGYWDGQERASPAFRAHQLYGV